MRDSSDNVTDDLGKNMEQLLASAIGEEHEDNADEWSNESLASNSSIGRVDLLDISDSELLEGDNYMEESINESGSGEGLSEFNLEDSSGSLSQSWKVVQSASMMKPPNVLIYTGKSDSVRKFDKVKKVIDQCLDNECYVVYHLRHEDIDTTPWTDNTNLLVIACRRHFDNASAAFLNFFKNGGKVIGFGSGFDSEIIGQTLLRKQIWYTQLSYKTWSNVDLITGGYLYNVKEVKMENCKATSLAVDKEGNVVIAKVTMDTKGLSGCYIMSQVSVMCY